MSTNPIENKIPVQTTQPGASAQTTPAVQPAPETENAFDAGQTGAPAETDEAIGMDTFVPSGNESAEELNTQKEKIQENNAALKESEAATQGEIDKYSIRIENQENYINDLNAKNADLNAQNTDLNAEIAALQNGLIRKNADLANLNANINSLNAQIKAAESFVGSFVNGFKNATGLFGGGVDVTSLKGQLATAEAKRDALQAEINQDKKDITDKGGIVKENEASIESNEASIERTEGYKNEYENLIADYEVELAKIQKMYQNGELSLEQIEAMSEELLKAEAQKQGSTEAPSKAQVKGTTAAINDILQKGELNTKSAEAIGNAVATQDIETGEFDAAAFMPAYEEAGFAPEEIGERIEIIEAVANYEEIGVNIDISDLASMSMTDLDAVVEQAIVQDVIKSTSTKIMGNTKGISSKKDMEAQSEARDNFIASNNALSGYYNANDVSDLEVQAFLTLSNNMSSNISQGYVYDTSSLQQMSSQAQSLLTSYQTKVNSSKGVAQDTDTQFLQERTKTEDILKEIETALGDDAQENNNYSDCMVEFLNLTTNYNNSETDSEKISYIKLMEELGEKAQRVQDDPNSKNPYVDGSLWIAA